MRYRDKDDPLADAVFMITVIPFVSHHSLHDLCLPSGTLSFPCQPVGFPPNPHPAEHDVPWTVNLTLHLGVEELCFGLVRDLCGSLGESNKNSVCNTGLLQFTR